MRALFLKELKDNRYVCFAVLVLMTAIAIAPGRFARAWAGISTFMLIPVLCCHFGARLLQSETEDDQLEMLLTLPISRARIWLAKTAAGVILTTVVMVLCGLAQHAKDPLSTRAGEYQAFAAAVLLLYALGAFFSLVWQRGQAASFSAFAVFVGGFTTVSYVRDQMPYHERFSGLSCGVFALGCMSIALATSYYVFTRADLLDGRDRRRTALRAGAIGTLAAVGWFYVTCLI